MSPRRSVSRTRSYTATLTYDTGALIAAENHLSAMWALHRRALRRGIQPVVPAVVLAQAWRGGPQHNLSRLVDSCVVESLGETAARQIGRLLGKTGTSDVVEAAVVLSAAERGGAVVTSDPDDLSALARAHGVELPLHRV